MHARVSRSTIRDFEGELHNLQPDTMRRVIDAIEGAGVDLIEGGPAGAGVRFRASTGDETTDAC